MPPSPLQVRPGPPLSTTPVPHLASPFPSYQAAPAASSSSSSAAPPLAVSSSAVHPPPPSPPPAPPAVLGQPSQPTPSSSSSSSAVKPPQTLLKSPERLAAEREKKRLKTLAKRERVKLARAAGAASSVGGVKPEGVAGPDGKGRGGSSVSVEVREVRWSSSSSPAPDRDASLVSEPDTPRPARPSPGHPSTSTNPQPSVASSSASPSSPVVGISRRPLSPPPRALPSLDLSTSMTTAADGSEPRTPSPALATASAPFGRLVGGAGLDKLELKRLKKKEKAARQKAAKKEAAAATAATASSGHPPAPLPSAASKKKAAVLKKLPFRLPGPPLGPVLVALPAASSSRRGLAPIATPSSSSPAPVDPARQDDVRRASALDAVTGYRPASSASFSASGATSFRAPPLKKAMVVVRLPSVVRPPSSAPSLAAEADAGPSQVRLKPPTRRHSPSPLRIVSPKPVHQAPRPIPLLASRANSALGHTTEQIELATEGMDGEQGPYTVDYSHQHQYQLQHYQHPPPPPPHGFSDPGLSYTPDFPPRSYPPPPPHAQHLSYPPPPSAQAHEHLMRSVMLPPGYTVDGGVYFDPATGQPYVYAYPTPPPTGANELHHAQQHQWGQQQQQQQQQHAPLPPPGPSPSPEAGLLPPPPPPPPPVTKIALGPPTMAPALAAPQPQFAHDVGPGFAPYAGNGGGAHYPPSVAVAAPPFAISSSPPPLDAFSPSGPPPPPPFAFAHSPPPPANYGHGGLVPHGQHALYHHSQQQQQQLYPGHPIQQHQPQPQHHAFNPLQPVFVPRRPGSAAVRIQAPLASSEHLAQQLDGTAFY